MFSDQTVNRGPKIKLQQRQGNDTYTERVLNKIPHNRTLACQRHSCPQGEEHGFCGRGRQGEEMGSSTPGTKIFCYMSDYDHMIQITSMLKFKFFKARLNDLSSASSGRNINSFG